MLTEADLFALERLQGFPRRRRSRRSRILAPPTSVVPPEPEQLIENAAAGISGWGAALGGALATAAGIPVLAPVGAAVGSLAESAIMPIATKKVKSFFGMGDYVLKSNSLVQTGGATDSDVQIVPQGNRAVRIVYREYLGDVYTHPTVPGAFNLASFRINPGLLSTFPWLAPIAQQYEQWTPNGIVFEFKSTSSEYVATQALGSVIMATEYDSLDSVYPNKQAMLNSAYSNEAKPSERIVHGVECDPRDTPNHIYYCRSGDTLPSNANIRDYDLGTFTIATQGGATANLNLGSLYVHYDITLRKEQLFNGVPLKGQLYQVVTRSGVVAGATPIGDTTTQSDGNIECFSGINRITFPTYCTGANWIVFIRWVGAAGAAFTPPVYTPTGCSVSGDYFSPNTLVVAAYSSTLLFVDQTSPVAYISFGLGGTLPTAPCSAQILIYQANTAD